MKRPLRIALLTLAAAAGLLLVGAAVLVARFDGDDLARLLGDQLQRTHDRQLRVAGGLTLRLWPRLAVTGGAMSLSERGSGEVFAEVDALELAVELLPLLRRQVVVDRVVLQGLRATVTRRADGSTSVDDLLAPPAEGAGAVPAAAGAAPFTLALAGLQLRDATLVFDDRRAGRRWALEALDLQSGPLAAGQPATLRLQARLRAGQPQVDATLTLAGSLLAQPDAGRGLAAARVTAPKLSATVDGQLGGVAVRGSLATPLALDLAAGTLALPDLALDLSLPHPRGGPLALQARGDAGLALDTRTGALQLAGRLDDSGFEAQGHLHGAASPAFELALTLDRLDLDRYRPASAAPGAAGGTAAGLPDLSALRELDGAGQLAVRQLQVAGLQAADLQLRWRAHDGRLVLDPMTAALYEGRLAGRLSLTAEAVPRLALHQRLNGVAAGPLLEAALGRAAVEGRGDVELDLTARGAGADALKRSLAGSGRVALKDGLVRGVNVAQVLRQVGAVVGGRVAEHTGTGSAAESTDFSALSGSFSVAGGVLRNDDLAAQLPLLRLAGAGTLDLGAGRLDYRLRASVVETLQGQGGAELQALRGLTLPLHLIGPLDAVRYRVDLGALVEDRARQALRDKGRALEERAKQDLADQLKELLRK